MTIWILKTRNLLIHESVQLIDNLLENMSRIDGSAGKIAYEKLKGVLNENPGYSQIKTISDILINKKNETKIELDAKK